jgi:hypothetical protein
MIDRQTEILTCLDDGERTKGKETLHRKSRDGNSHRKNKMMEGEE